MELTIEEAKEFLAKKETEQLEKDAVDLEIFLRERNLKLDMEMIYTPEGGFKKGLRLIRG